MEVPLLNLPQDHCALKPRLAHMLVTELRAQRELGRGAEEGHPAAFCRVAEGLPGETREFCGACWVSLPELEGAGLLEVLLTRQCLSLKMNLVSEILNLM
jgi:hypothetical protein